MESCLLSFLAYLLIVDSLSSTNNLLVGHQKGNLNFQTCHSKKNDGAQEFI